VDNRVADLLDQLFSGAANAEKRFPKDRDLVRHAGKIVVILLGQGNSTEDPEELAFVSDSTEIQILVIGFVHDDDGNVVQEIKKALRDLGQSFFNDLVELGLQEVAAAHTIHL